MTIEQVEGAVESLYADYLALEQELRDSPSGLTALNRSYHKHLLMAAASGLEGDVKRLVPLLFAKYGDEQLSTFVAKRVMARSYHTLFDWRAGNANAFFGSFGDTCGTAFKGAMKEDAELKTQHDAFIKLGQLRNEVVHNDYASASIDSTPEEIMSRYALALKFIARIEEFITHGRTAS